MALSQLVDLDNDPENGDRGIYGELERVTQKIVKSQEKNTKEIINNTN